MNNPANTEYSPNAVSMLDVGPTLKQHWVNAPWLLGRDALSPEMYPKLHNIRTLTWLLKQSL